MFRQIMWLFLRVILCLVIVGSVFSLPSFAFAQAGSGAGVGAGENPWSDNSRTPFEVVLDGIINSEPAEESSLAVVTLGIPEYRETYKFEIVNATAPGNPQVSARQILQKIGTKQYDFRLVGPNALLSKVAQAQPGTPLKLTGMYEQRGQRLQLTNVEVLGMTNTGKETPLDEEVEVVE